MVAHTCRYSIRLLILNSATSHYRLSVGIGYHPRFFTFIHITPILIVELQIFPDAFLFTFLKHNNQLQLVNLLIPLQKKEWLVCASRINYWNTHKPACIVLSYIYVMSISNISKELHKKHLCNPSSHTENTDMKRGK